MMMSVWFRDGLLKNAGRFRIMIHHYTQILTQKDESTLNSTILKRLTFLKSHNMSISQLEVSYIRHQLKND